jgi:hypothetical protein
MGARWTFIQRSQEVQVSGVDFAWRSAFIKADNCIDIGSVFY